MFIAKKKNSILNSSFKVIKWNVDIIILLYYKHIKFILTKYLIKKAQIINGTNKN